MNIWVIGRSYPTKQNKMRGSFELEQAQMFAAHGHNIIYIAAILHPFNKVKKWGFCNFRDYNVEVYTYSAFFFPERLHFHSKKVMDLMWKKLLSEVEKKNGIPDIIHIHYPGLIAISDSIFKYQEKGTKIVLTEHWSKTLTNTMDPFQKNQLTKLVNNANAVIAVGQPLKDALINITNTNKKIQVVPNIVSNLFMQTIEKYEKTIFDFIVVGRLSPMKQVDLIILAFAKEFKDRKDVHLTIVGDGKEKKKIRKIIDTFQIEDQVTMTGTLTREETASKMMSSDALVCFSKLETFGVPVIEAWACGKPVIASDSLGFLEYWNDQLGYIVSNENIKHLQNAMQQILKKRNLYKADIISKYAQENFGEEVIYKRLIKIYVDEMKRNREL